MLRALYCSLPALIFIASALPADEKPDKKDDSKVDPRSRIAVQSADHFLERYDANKDGFIPTRGIARTAAPRLRSNRHEQRRQA